MSSDNIRVGITRHASRRRQFYLRQARAADLSTMRSCVEFIADNVKELTAAHARA